MGEVFDFLLPKNTLEGAVYDFITKTHLVSAQLSDKKQSARGRFQVKYNFSEGVVKKNFLFAYESVCLRPDG